MRKRVILLLSILFLFTTGSLKSGNDFFENGNKNGIVTLSRLVNIGGIWSGHGIKSYVNFNLTYYASGVWISSEVNFRDVDSRMTFSGWRYTPISLDVNLLHGKDLSPALLLGVDASYLNNKGKNNKAFVITPHISVDALFGTLKVGYDYDFKHRLGELSVSLTISPSTLITAIAVINRH